MNGQDKLTKALIALQSVEDLTCKKKSSLISIIEDPAKLFDLSIKPLVEKVLGINSAVSLYEKLHKVDIIIDNLIAKDIKWVTIYDEEYSDLLLEIDNPPIVLFCLGDVSLLKRDSIAVIGTRKPTRYGAKIADSFSRQFANAGLVVVSGFARGVDTIAHFACVDNKLPTLAVIASGLDICYPAENKGLMKSIIENGGLIISEHSLGIRPLPYHFPSRNRIISGLSRAVFLPEAALKSGSLITIRLALEQNRDIFIVPANINSKESEGSNALLQEMPHAFTLCPEDVLSALNIRTKQKPQEFIELSLIENLIVQSLHDKELHFEEILEKTRLQVSELNILLTNLEINGIVDRISGNFYCLS